ncbi:sn-glycerol-3-phosphate ABC transporter permease UgpA [Ketogulonicigenium vulgare]|uniref:sn-glycerol-3-phosphate transport system permease protein UgpA n=1 Tax=Ketogulonicigenium vulgare (strain WSH-001) TaxID=759362 RepID=F9Y5S8_KETVW|nr:sn-glycerol-3-phosphate ABC transporter permease UgpA [Ketogulonicigenium vulgare]ADO43740.1 sn-glycerol-3-phosphate ABC transporter, permease protein [Ketogulonicigenium vulgare Y25]AEM42003.1 putative sugar ABC transporter Permease protein [Ketogulonicigenium vulgare WSH-001]ALJ82101.1 glycerol-3-phosphate transporter permease [Ketogulonicigenium vulgare]ANW34726.1 glycerol-3-phosphate transporter permease [Ketogulonicigenium vulgare]AOZ55771.1 sn-glycerol-3-phosphate ABC transporter perm
MQSKRAIFPGQWLPWVLLAPQLAITLIFFIWPAGQAVWFSFLRQDPFGLSSTFIWFDNYARIFRDPSYLKAINRTVVFAVGVTVLAMSISILLAVAVNRVIRANRVYSTLLVWPYAVAPVVAGALWWFMFNPTLGILPHALKAFGITWNHRIDGNQAMLMVILAATWKQVSYNFLFFLAGLQSIPQSLTEAAAIDGAGPIRRFWTIVFPLLSPTTFFLLIINMNYVLFDTFGTIDGATAGGPNAETTTLVYKVYADGVKGLNLGASAAQSVVLMGFVILLTFIQFRYVERRVQY